MKQKGLTRRFLALDLGLDEQTLRTLLLPEFLILKLQGIQHILWNEELFVYNNSSVRMNKISKQSICGGWVTGSVSRGLHFNVLKYCKELEIAYKANIFSVCLQIFVYFKRFFFNRFLWLHFMISTPCSVSPLSKYEMLAVGM